MMDAHKVVNPDDGRCAHGVMWGDRTDVLGRNGVRLCSQCESAARMVVTDCCGRLLPESRTLRNDVHFSDLCPACLSLDGSEHESHVTCKGDDCPGRDWTYDPVTHKVVKP